MTLVGLMTDYPLPELLHDLGSRGRSGLLSLCSGGHEVDLVLCGGGVVSATTSDARFRVGQRFTASGHLTGGQLDDILHTQREGRHKSTGALLVERGLATERDVQAIMAEQVDDLLFRVLTHPRGYFSFRQGSIVPTRVPVDISLERSVLRAIARADEWMRGQIESARIEIAEDVTAAMILPAVQESWPVLEALLDGAETLDEIVALSGEAPEVARAGIAALSSQGVIHLLGS